MDTLEGMIRKILEAGVYVTVSIGALVLGGCSGSERKDWLYFDMELVKLGPGSDSHLYIDNVPGYVRNVPTHPDDPAVDIPALPNRKYDLKYDFGTNEMFNFRVWLFDVISAGVGGMYGEDSEDLNEYDVGERYNYAVHYPQPWGAAYTMYETDAVLSADSVRYFFEAKTPTLKLGSGDTQWALSLFGGYQPDLGKINITASDGWHRWGKPEIRNSYDLGEITFDRAYVGVEIGWADKETKFSQLGFRIYYIEDSVDTDLTPAGRDFGVRVEDPEPRIAGSLFFRF